MKLTTGICIRSMLDVMLGMARSDRFESATDIGLNPWRPSIFFVQKNASTTGCYPFPPPVNDDVFRVSAPGATLVEHDVLHQRRTIHAHPSAEPDGNHRAPLVVQRQPHMLLANTIRFHCPRAIIVHCPRALTD